MDLVNFELDDSFSMIALTSAINILPYTPGTVNAKGWFNVQGIRQPQFMVEELNETTAVIPAGKRGGPSSLQTNEKRTNRTMSTIPYLVQDAIRADSLIGVRDFGTNMAKSLSKEQARVLARLRAKHDLTLEFQRIKALQGSVVDSDGSTVLYNLFTVFNVSQQSVNFALGTTTTDMMAKCLTVRGYIESALGGAVAGGAVTAEVLCGATWFNSFVTHPMVKQEYRNYMVQMGANPNKDDLRFGGFTFGGLTFYVYRDFASPSFISTNEAYACPTNVPGLYQTVCAPADYMECVGTEGQLVYVKTKFADWDKGIEFDSQSHTMSYVTKPASIIKITSS